MAIENYTFKIDLNPSFSFSQRENKINVDIQKKMDELNLKGYITRGNEIINKTQNFATIKLELEKMPNLR
jgi:hypothetical protein